MFAALNIMKNRVEKRISNNFCQRVTVFITNAICIINFAEIMNADVIQLTSKSRFIIKLQVLNVSF